MRPLFHQFIRRIHPDLLPAIPEAKSANTFALQHLNHFLDHLESSDPIPNPLTAQTLPLFLLKSNGRLKPSSLTLPPIPPSADFLEKREIAFGLSAEITRLLIDIPAVNRRAPLAPEVESLLPRGPEGWTKLFDKEIQNQHTKQLLYTPPLSKAEAYKKYLQVKTRTRLERKYSRIQNKISRKLKLKKLDSIVEHVVRKRLANGEQNCADTDSSAVSCKDLQDTKENIFKLASLGYNPHFVFFARDLTPAEVRKGLASLAGEGLTTDADKWLLENIFRALRESEPPVPVVLGRTFSANSDFGFLEIPTKCGISELAEFVDEWVDEVREIRKKVLEEARARYSK
jgi:hypothetical protein